MTPLTNSAGQIVLTSSGAGGVVIAEASVSESKSFTYRVHLDTQLASSTETVSVIITSSSSKCTPTPSVLTFGSSLFSTPQTVTVAADQDDTDQGISGMFATCSLTHAVKSTDI